MIEEPAVLGVRDMGCRGAVMTRWVSFLLAVVTVLEESGGERVLELLVL
jgi:hypothetical protein